MNMKWKGELTSHQMRMFRIFKRAPDVWVKRILETKPPKKRTDPQKHTRNVSIFHTYWSTKKSLRDLAKEYGLSVATVRTIVYRYLNIVYRLHYENLTSRKHEI